MDLLNYILSLPILVNNIYLISLVISGIVIIFLEEKVLRGFIFPVADLVKEKTARGIGSTSAGKRHSWMAKILSEGLATLIFIFYSYLGVSILTDYVTVPILTRVRGIITLVVIALFFLLSYCINNLRLRKKFFV